MELTNVHISEVAFKERLAKTDYSVVFLVFIRDRTCVMKVVSVALFAALRLPTYCKQHHGRGPKQPYETSIREKNIHILRIAV